MGTAAVQGEIWGSRARDWADINEPAWRVVFETAMRQAGAAPGKRLLDIGCGAGGALVIAAGKGAEVAGLDASANLVAIARKRLPNAPIELGEMEMLPFADRSFDIVTGINSFQFAGNLAAALAEARRVLEEDGALLMLVWGRREDCELVAGTASAVFALLPPAPDARPPLPLAESGAIEGVMAQAGLKPTGSGEFSASLSVSDAESAVRMVLAASARAIRAVGEATVADVIRGTLPPFTRPDGSIVWNNRFRWVKATPA